MRSWSLAAGYRVLIHDQTENVQLGDAFGLDVSVEMATSIALTQANVRLVYD